MRTLSAILLALLGLALILAGSYLGLVYFIGYDGIWTSDLLWIVVPAAIGLVLVALGIRAIRSPAPTFRQVGSQH